jgi:hypothetical protein
MAIRLCFAALVVFLITCAPDKVVPIFLTIIQPPDIQLPDVDTIRTPSIPIEGLTTVGATIHVGGALNDTGLIFPVDNTGHFVGHLPIEDLTGTYAAIFRVTKPGANGITESRTVYYVQQP